MMEEFVGVLSAYLEEYIYLFSLRLITAKAYSSF